MSTSPLLFNKSSRAISRLGTALCIGLAIGLAQAQPSEAASPDRVPQVQDYLSRSQVLLQKQRLDEAQHVLEEGVTAFKKVGRGDSLEGLELQLNLGGVFYQKGQLNEALKRFDYVRITRQKILGISHEHTRMAYQNVTQTLLDLKQPDKAIDILREFVRADESQGTPVLNNEIWALDWIKEIQQNQNDFDSALITSKSLLSLCLASSRTRVGDFQPIAIT